LIEARVALLGALRRLWVHLLEISQNGPHRGAETIQIEAVKAGPVSVGCKRVIVLPQPLDKLDHISVAPHPYREAPELG
jgi:hypothetical protein